MQITPYINDLGTDINDIQIKLGDIAIERFVSYIKWCFTEN